jgi:hypothetical protein
MDEQSFLTLNWQIFDLKNINFAIIKGSTAIFSSIPSREDESTFAKHAESDLLFFACNKLWRWKTHPMNHNERCVCSRSIP